MVSLWEGVDRELELPLDVIDDFEAEAREFRRAGNNWFAYTPEMHSLREGASPLRLLDLLDERKFLPGEVRPSSLQTVAAII